MRADGDARGLFCCLAPFSGLVQEQVGLPILFFSATQPLPELCGVGQGELKQLLAAGASVDEPDVDGETALMEAARLGQESSVEALLLGGAAIERRDKEGCTALMVTRTNVSGICFFSMNTANR